jgi:hypothetical protein
LNLRLKEIKKVWEKMIDTASRSLLITGPKLTATENKMLDDLFDIKNHSTLIKLQPSTSLTTQYISLPTAKAIIINTINSSPFLILLQRIYYIRHLILNPNWEFSFVREKNHLIYAAYKNSNVTLDKEQSRKFLFDKPTENEFTLGLNIITNHIDSLNDGINPQEILDWLNIFHIQNIPEFQGKTFSQIRKIYNNISYNNFLIQWKKIFKDI